jgi:hypothetical protein
VLLAALLGALPYGMLRRLQLVMSPDTVLSWHRDLLDRRHAVRGRPRRAGCPRTAASIRRLVLRLARENGIWGYRRIHGELALLGVTVAASTVWEILEDAGVDPWPDRAATGWATFLRGRAEAIPACDLIESTQPDLYGWDSRHPQPQPVTARPTAPLRNLIKPCPVPARIPAHRFTGEVPTENCTLRCQ